MATDALHCYTYLVEHIPKWIQDLSALHRQMNEKLAETEVVAIKPKNDSVDSIHPDEPTPKPSNNALPPSPAALQASPLPASPGQPAKRKRDTPSLPSFAGPGRYRTRQMVVVYYDSEVQKTFEELVRAIGVSRNQIRKARNAARLEAMAALSQFDMEDDDTAAELSEMSPKLSLSGFRSTRSRGLPPAAGNSNRIFDEMDGILEKAQGLCERAAHQCLRDGNALAQINHIRTNFEELLQLCTQEISAKEEEAKKQHEHGACVDQPPKQSARTNASSPPAKTLLPTLSIEVNDDDDPDAEPIVLPPIRLTSRA